MRKKHNQCWWPECITILNSVSLEARHKCCLIHQGRWEDRIDEEMDDIKRKRMFIKQEVDILTDRKKRAKRLLMCNNYLKRSKKKLEILQRKLP